jgi:hypothetical protein
MLFVKRMMRAICIGAPLGYLGWFATQAAGGGEVHLFGGFVELPEGDGEEDEDDRPKRDKDGRRPLGGEVRPEMEEGPAVTDADPDGDRVAEEAADGEGPHEFFARHVHGTGDEDEGRERHRRGKQSGQRDGEDGVVLHPVGDAGEDGSGDVLLEEGEAAGVANGVRKEAAESRADGGECDEKEDVGVGGGEGNEQDVGDAGDGEWDEGAIDRGDGEQADEAHMTHEVHEAGVRVRVGMRVGPRYRSGLENEIGRERREGDGHAGDMTLAHKGKSRFVSVPR